MLAAHSIELFLEGAILIKPNKAWGQTLGGLNSTHHDIHSENKLQIKCLFRTEYIEISEEEQKTIKKEIASAKYLFRYLVK